MNTYRISNRSGGAILGLYEGTTPDKAIAAMLADAGCDDEPDPSLVAEAWDTTADAQAAR